jgi:fructokinase
MRVLGIGEILWDELPTGRALGGAPFNVTAQLTHLGHQASYVTAVGADPPGRAALAEARRRGIDTSLIRVTDAAPTGVARVTTGDSGGADFEIVRPAAYEYIRVSDAALDRIAAERADALVFGTLAQCQARVLDATEAIAAAVPGAIRLYDVNLRAGWWWPPLVIRLMSLATVVKLAEAEARVLAPVLGLEWQGAQAFCQDLAGQRGLRAVAVTAGSGTAALWLDGELALARPPAATVADPVGAGDAFSAGLADAVSREMPAALALRRANALGTLIASRRGALPAWAAEDLALLEYGSPSH